MANPEQLAILAQGVEVWNQWRSENLGVKINLREENLQWIKLVNANLIGADLTDSDLSKADLRGANLSQANLDGARLILADLRGANFYQSTLAFTFFYDANLNHCDFLQSVFSSTILNDIDLRRVKNLETIRHLNSSHIDISTIYRSQGQIPEVFLRGCGVPDNFIEYMHSLTSKAFDYYSAFLSYSSKDTEFTEKLYDNLQGKGIRCWYAPEDLKIGDKFRKEIDSTIRLRDKLIVVLSEESIRSDWVEEEVDTALAEEKRTGKLILFPIRIDDAILETDQYWARRIQESRHIGDFSKWKQHDEYQKSFERLLRDLTKEPSR